MREGEVDLTALEGQIRREGAPAMLPARGNTLDDVLEAAGDEVGPRPRSLAPEVRSAFERFDGVEETPVRPVRQRTRISEVTDPTRRQAIRRLRDEREEVLELVGRLPPRARGRPGLGGGEWSPKDLIGHLESWEEHALAALDAWSRDEPAPIDRALRTEGLTTVNRAEVERKAGRSVAAALAAANTTHGRLIAAIEEMPARVWNAPATSRGRVSLGHRVGQILAGTREPFAHDAAHLKDLRSYVAEHGSGA